MPIADEIIKDVKNNGIKLGISLGISTKECVKAFKQFGKACSGINIKGIK